ncbi:ABC transporter permease [Marinactinospora thermotolerans]|uniref:ABC-2 family transporter protein n=1 Tax=Marinactinospora thermotolerans DSM 45154 TaxID=1122192 RepID=A0A1T4N8Y1_9ACTN|nr:ABC transporter permease [Marinactinospora thermotolerans]SJZ75694.1 ABC-2 family transporter protein [Marinactinospora thermotolerans DSM 45154]
MTGLVKAELRKFFSTRLWWIMLLVVLAWTGLGLSLSIALAGMEGQPARDTVEFQQMAWIYGGGTSSFTMILGIVMMTSEYRHRTFNSTFLVTPVRGRVIVAKLVTGLLVGLLFGAAVMTLTAAAVIPATLTAGGEFSPFANEIPRMTAGVVAAITLYVLLGIGLGALIRNQVGAIMTGIVWTFLLETIVVSVPGLQEFGKWTPGGVTTALYDTGADFGFGAAEVLPMGTAVALLTGYALLFSLIASFTTVRRDLV